MVLNAKGTGTYKTRLIKKLYLTGINDSVFQTGFDDVRCDETVSSACGKQTVF